MNRKLTHLLIFIIPLFLPSCRNNEQRQERTGDLMSVRTLGLAYLEEFKVEEAEKEFLKFIEMAPGDKFGYANLGLTYLRSGDYPEAEKQLKKAIAIDSLDADIRLILATVYRVSDQTEKAVAELKKALNFAPGHIKVLHEISEIYSARTDAGSINERKGFVRKLIQSAPGNLVPKLSLAEILINTGDNDGALEQLEIIRSQFPEFPKEAGEYYNQAIDALRKNNTEDAVLNYTIFHNYLKVTPPYQAGMVDLKGPGGSLIGFPLITFDRKATVRDSDDSPITDQIRFTQVAEASGLFTSKAGAGTEFGDFSHVTTADYDGDGDIDIYASGYDESSSSFVRRLYNNNSGIFTNVAADAGINHTGRESFAIFADYDNDGYPDLYVLREEGDILYRNTGNGKFENVTVKANVGSKTGGNMALFFDADHDGDLDLFVARSGMNLLFRNNADGTFTEVGEQMNLAGGNSITSGAAFGDFDEDGDIDLIVTNENEENQLYSNQRQSIFRDVAYEAGIPGQSGSAAVAAADYNNDGFLDIFIGSVGKSDHMLYRNTGNGKFEPAGNTGDLFRVLRNQRIADVRFLDFDNDGYSDLFIAGEKLFLFHNNRNGAFTDVSHLLPQNIGPCKRIAVFDYNEDGDLDLALAGSNGSTYLLRNDGGNINHHVKITLVGLRAGSAKNNHFGIGAKVEMRAGDLYQTMVVSDPNIHFGIGNRKMADVIRITWTNGVPQNIFYPAADQALIESQTLKGSCPFLYAWDGEKYGFVKDILWRSGLGMPLGIMGGTTAYAFADASDDYLKIQGEAMKPEGGKYRIQVTSELWETIYLDKLNIVAVDHPASTSIWVEEQFTPPPFPGMKIFQAEKEIIPVSAADSRGNDVLQYIKAKDDNYLSAFMTDKYQGITEMQEITLDPGPSANGNIVLYMNGWIFPTDASINVALSQSDAIKVVPPEIQVIDRNGRWVTVIDGLGFPMGKDKTVIADLSGKFLSSDRRVRVRTNMQIYWDYIFFSEKKTEGQLTITRMEPVAADLHYRGFSKEYRKGGRYGPIWFDYNEVSEAPRWRDLSGNYTRYGNVLPLLIGSDNMYVISNAGDEITVEFDASMLPALRPGWKRDFLVNSVGWVKDGDINTAYGNTVDPLPFHGMKSYPPSPEDRYPANPRLQRYHEEYNTRVVTGDAYLNALKH
jgi:tetratricopeptide (TPR) repeat protein